MIEVGDIKQLSEFHDYDFTKYKGEQRLNKVARNLVDYEAGKTILATALSIMLREEVTQTTLF
jgi:DNA (cytosine-5)-methyltransferase 1